MSDKIKPLAFSQESYDTNDSLGKKILEDYLVFIGYEILSSVENYEHDIVALNRQGKKEYFEVEMKSGYPFTSMPTFKFPSVSFLGRKKRLHEIHPFFYVIICAETEYALTLRSDKIFLDQYTEKIRIETHLRQGLDTMFRVPKNLCKFFKIKL